MIYEYDNLRDDILSFIQKLGTVKQEQVCMMFKNVNSKTVLWHIESLKAGHHITIDDNNVIRAIGAPKLKDYAQELLLQAIWVLANVGAENTRDFYTCTYPFQLLFVTEEDKVYDVCVFSYGNINSNALILKRVMTGFLPENVEDEVIHIAIVQDQSMAKRVVNLNFDSLCIIEKNGNPGYFNI